MDVTYAAKLIRSWVGGREDKGIAVPAELRERVFQAAVNEIEILLDALQSLVNVADSTADSMNTSLMDDEIAKAKAVIAKFNAPLDEKDDQVQKVSMVTRSMLDDYLSGGPMSPENLEIVRAYLRTGR